MKIPKISAVSLIEFLVASALSGIMCVSALGLYLGAKRTGDALNALSRMAENMRIVSLMLEHVIGHAGYFGCAQFPNHVVTGVHYPKDWRHAQRGDISQWIGAFSPENEPHRGVYATALKRMVRDSDVLWTRQCGEPHALVQGTRGQKGMIQVQGDLKAQPLAWMMIADCSHMEVFKAQPLPEYTTGRHTTWWSGILEGSQLKHWYEQNAQLGAFQTRYVYVGRTSRHNAMGRPIDALYLAKIPGKSEEIVEGVEHLSVEFGVFENNSIGFYSKEDIQDWDQVHMVRVHLVFNSIEEIPLGFLDGGRMKSRPTERDRRIRRSWVGQWRVFQHRRSCKSFG